MTKRRRESSTGSKATEAVDESGGGVRSVERALLALELLADAADGLRLAEIAHRLGLAASTVHRLLCTLEDRGFVRFDRPRLRWSIGRTALTVGANFAATRDIVGAASPALARLRHATRETVNLGIVQDGTVSFVARLSPSGVPLSTRPAAVPVHGSSIGKAILAWQPEREVRGFLRIGLAPATARSITEGSHLLAQLASVRRHGFAVDDEENTVGLRCVAAAVHDEYRRPVAAVSVAAPADRLGAAHLLTAGEIVAAAAREMTRAIGGLPPR
jgi:IclR family acetate operon transcriptional repressor